jgi:hypothetical protein
MGLKIEGFVFLTDTQGKTVKQWDNKGEGLYTACLQEVRQGVMTEFT